MDFDAIVVGGGHSGIEAALALARLECRTLIITQSLDAIGRLSCNPAVGGLSKGNMVREIDALGGEMGKLIDATMIQFRILNLRRGPAVQAPRAQADKFAYSRIAKETLESQPGLSIFQDTVVDLKLSEEGGRRRVRGVLTERRREFTAERVILNTGTFMEGKIFIGDYAASSGRLGEPAAVGLGDALRRHGFTVGRLKTGTPARVRRSSIDFDEMEEQKGDEEMLPFSFLHDSVDRPSVSCYITHTGDPTHEIIRKNIDRSPLYGGKIVGLGPRYCPSIEDKVVRFPDRSRHQIFVEPEGLGSEEMYLNGISSSLPEEVQERFIRSLPGLRRGEIMRPGYAVEYDYVDPRQLLPSLESKMIEGLYMAGQINGTSGYEEAGVQGLLAGINAALSLRGREPLILSRAEAYAGVLVDDLVTIGTEEPYRMFTSRAEYRLNLRHHNADIRLTGKGREIGLVDDERWERFQEKLERIEEIRELAEKRRIGTKDGSRWSGCVGKTLLEALKVPELDFQEVFALAGTEEGDLGSFRREWLEHVALEAKYEGYIRRQQVQVDRFHRLESMRIPPNFDYDAVNGISTESRQKLKEIRPVSVGQASRVSGVRSSDIAVLMVAIGRGKEATEKKRHESKA
jgi:tRNA uridine 5-carboxymethylaminomethyl modification enzyme